MLRKVLPHAAILLSNMYIVFYLIDRVNSAMCFIDNRITKALLVLLAVISTVNASFLILDERRKIARNERRHAQPRPAPRDPERPAPRPLNQTAQRTGVPRYDSPCYNSSRYDAPARRSRFGE